MCEVILDSLVLNLPVEFGWATYLPTILPHRPLFTRQFALCAQTLIVLGAFMEDVHWLWISGSGRNMEDLCGRLGSQPPAEMEATPA